MNLEDAGIKEGKPHFSISGFCMHSHNYGNACFNGESIINYTLDYKILSFHRESHCSNRTWKIFCEMLHYLDHELIKNHRGLQVLMPKKM